jgi:c-di-GMP-binding flagellar brake protein YcgR
VNKLENFRDIPIGTKMELNVTDPIEGKLDIGFVSQIEGIIDENIVRISAPIHEARVYPIRINSRIEAYLFYKSNQIYKVSGYVVDRLIVDDIALLDLKATEKIQKIQRRQFYRFKCSVPVTFDVLQSKDLEEVSEEIFGHTIDLSGGGLSTLTGKPLWENNYLQGKLELEDGNFIDFNGKVIRCIKKIVNDELKYISSIVFTDIDYKKRERIVGFIFNQQRLLLKKELR